MNKLINWTLGSFFRTLGRILVYILLAFLLSYLLKDVKLPKLNIFQVLDVSADAQTMYLKLNNYNWSGSVWISGGTNVTLNINNGGVLTDIDETYNYGYIKFCSYQPITSWYSSNSQIKNISFYDTGIPCKGPTWGFNGSLRYLTFDTEFACSVQGTNCGFDSNIVFYQENSSDYFPLQYGFLNQQIEIDYTSGEIIKQNNQIISGQQSIINNQNSNSQAEINNANQNKTDIINNQNSNSQAQIDNANSNTDKTIDSQKVCKYFDKSNIYDDNKLLDSVGNLRNDNNYGVTDFISIYKADLTFNTYSYTWSATSCYYDNNKTLINCKYNYNLNTNDVPSNAYYIRLTISKSLNKPTLTVCQNGNQATNDTLNDMNSSINNSDSSQATNDASNFFSNFTTNTHGLTGIITAPLSAIQSLSSQQCSPLILPLPFVNENLTLPCMRDIYTQYFGDFMTLYDIITLGIISYWVMVRIFGLVKDFKNPEHDEIEVLDL